jgi:hypothetical protein
MRTWALVPVLGAIVLLAGCSVSPFNVLSDEQRIDLRDGASAYQQEVLADLVVDEAEYRQAMSDWHGCVASAGAEASEITQNGQQLGFEYSVEAANEDALALIQAPADACLPEYFDVISRVWVSQETKLS